jgi:hypothetical protein
MVWRLVETSWALKNLPPGLPSAFLAPFFALPPNQPLEAALGLSQHLQPLDGLWLPPHPITVQSD